MTRAECKAARVRNDRGIDWVLKGLSFQEAADKVGTTRSAIAGAVWRAGLKVGRPLGRGAVPPSHPWRQGRATGRAMGRGGVQV